MTLDPDSDMLYVADTENHLLRAVNLTTRTVTTLAGTGEQARFQAIGGDALTSAMNSPWDLALVSGYIMIAMAGPHQIWLYDHEDGKVGIFAGSGAEARVDGNFATAAFAQPSGITTDGALLFVADSETSSIRQINIMEGEVSTLAGLDLFEFGDVDGTGDTVRLQHPLGVAYGDGALYIADTYNSKVKRLDLFTGEVRTVAGTGTSGSADGVLGALYEPGGLSLAGNTLYIADTNNHAIRCLDLISGVLSTLPISDTRGTEQAGEFFPALETVSVPPQTVAADAPATLAITLALPPEHHLNLEAPNGQYLRVDGEKIALPAPALIDNTLTVPLAALTAGTHDLQYTLTLYYCREGNEAACTLRSLQWQVPVTANSTAAHAISLTATLTPQVA